MYRVFYIMAWTFFYVLILTSGAFALWSGESQADKPPARATALIIKFSPGIKVNQGFDKSGIVQTSDADLNSRNHKYTVRKQERLLSEAASIADDNPLKGVHLFYPETAGDIAVMAKDYTQLAAVEFAYPDYPLELYDLPDDPLFAHQWSLNNTGQGYYHVERISGTMNDTLAIVYGTPDADIDALEVYENPPDATKPVVVAIIDTGVDTDHPELAGRIWHNPGEIPDNGIDDDHNGYIDDVVGWNFVDILYGEGNNDPTDDHGHGTHCAGIVAALTDNATGISGIVPEAQIMAVKIFFSFTLTGACRGIIYAADNGADVVNMSWGMCWPVPILEDVLEYARARGVILVASSGNHGDDRYAYPASFPATISVGATNSYDHVTDFSTHNDALSLCAPGQSVLSLRAAGTDMYAEFFEPIVHIIDDQYYLASGTSMSGPHVVAAAAYMRSISPGLTPDSAQSILQNTADDYIDPYGVGAYLPGYDIYSGYGRLNLPQALAATPRTRAIIASPSSYSVVSGTVDIIGLADGPDFPGYTLEYGVGDMPILWEEIVTSPTPVVDDLLGQWSCDGLEGRFTLRLRIGQSNAAYKHIFICDQPRAQIQYPSEGQVVSGEIAFSGTAVCPDFDYFTLEYGAGESPTTWNDIATGTAPVFEGDLAEWSTIDQSPGNYSVRLSAYSGAGLEMSDTVVIEIRSMFTPPNGWTVSVGSRLSMTANYADVNQDGVNEIMIGCQTGFQFYSVGGAYLTSGVPNLPYGDYRVPAAVGRLDDDEFDDFVVVEASGTLYGFPSAGTPFQVTLTEPPDNMTYFITGSESLVPKLFLRDINNDGIDEIHYHPGTKSLTRSGYYFIYNADGSPWGCNFPPSPAYKRCLPADLDGDGIDEIYCYGSNLAQFDTCGQWVRAVPVELDGLPVNSYQLDLSAVDIDADGRTELIVHGYFNSGPVEVFNNWVFAYDENLQLKTGWPHDLGINGRLLAPGHPVFGDLDEDGSLEYVMVHSDQEYGYVHAWHIDGTPVQGCDCTDGIFAVTGSPACLSVPLIVDCDNNGFADIAVTSGAGLLDVTMIERIMAFNANTDFVEGYPLVVGNEYEDADMHVPVYGDINQDGFLDVVYPSDHGYIMFANFPDCPYNPDRAYCPMWRYNRRLNATKTFATGSACGDANGDFQINVGDAVYLINYIFKDGPGPDPLCIGNANGDENVNVGDAVFLINFIFRGGPAPVGDCCL